MQYPFFIDWIPRKLGVLLQRFAHFVQPFDYRIADTSNCKKCFPGYEKRFFVPCMKGTRDVQITFPSFVHGERTSLGDFIAWVEREFTVTCLVRSMLFNSYLLCQVSLCFLDEYNVDEIMERCSNEIFSSLFQKERKKEISQSDATWNV